MKKLIVAVLCLSSSMAFAAGTAACANAAGSGTAIAGDATKFVQVDFTPKCSANTYVAFEQNNVAFAAAGGSGKGKTVFGGHTGGGGVVSVGACAATGCTATEPGNATGALLTAANPT